MKRILSAIIGLGLMFSLLSGCAVIYNKVPNGIENVYIVSASENYRKDEYIPSTPETKLTASLAKREGEGMQFILKFPHDVTDVKVNMSELVLKNGTEKIERISVYKEHYVYCDEAYNKFAPAGFYPDALIPIDKDLQINNSVDIKAKENQGYWITVNTSPEQTAGLYEGKVSVTYNGDKNIEIPVEVEVWDFELPQKSSFESAYRLEMWFVRPYIGDNTAPEVYDSIDMDKLHKEIYDWFLDYRVSSGLIPVEYNTAPSKIAEQQIEYMKAHPEISCFTMGDNYNKDYADTLEAAGYLQYGYTYMFDEPMDYDKINQNISDAYKWVHVSNPHIRNMLTAAPREDIFDCDIWCPIWSSYGCDEYVVRDYQRKGDEMWWYGCVAPKAPYPTYHIMDELMSSRLVHWMQKDFNVTGNLYWSTSNFVSFDFDQNIYVDKGRDIWSDPYVFRDPTGKPAGAAGDGQLFYLGLENDGYVNKLMPVPTLRLESVRDGSEDYEYLVLLENKIKTLFEKWGIKDITVDEYMDTYYDALYDSMGDFDYGVDMMLEMRKRVAHDILNAESLVMVSSDPTPSCVNRRTVSVFAENGSSVTIDGKAVEGKNMGSYSLYEASFDMSKLPDLTDLEIKVNGVTYKRTLKSLTDAEYMSDAKLKVERDAEALGLDVSLVRKVYTKNTFIPFEVPNLGSLEDQLNAQDFVAKEYISKNPEMREKVIASLVTEYNNDIPVAVLNEPNLAVKGSEEVLSIYVPKGATVKVNGVAAELIETNEKHSLYRAVVDTGDVSRYAYGLSVTYNGKTETTTKFVLSEVTESIKITAFDNPQFMELMTNPRAGNDGMIFELVTYDGEPALKVTFKTLEDRITVPGASFAHRNWNGMTHLYMDVVNLQDRRMDGMDVIINDGRNNVPIDFVKIAENYDGFISAKLPTARYSKVSSLTFTVGSNWDNVERGCGSYIIKNIYAVKEKTE